MSSNTRPVVPPVPTNAPEADWPRWLKRIAEKINLILQGKVNATNTVTLTANAATTTLYDSRIGYFSHVGLAPATANAALDVLTAPGIYVVPGDGSAVINHPNTAAVDKTFSVCILN